MGENWRTFFAKKMNELKIMVTGSEGCTRNENSTGSTAAVRPCSTFEETLQRSTATARTRLYQEIDRATNSSSSTSSRLVNEEGLKESNLNRQTKSRAGAAENSYEMRHYVADGVRFRCPTLIPDEVLSESEWRVKIKEYLYAQLESDKGLAAALIIRNCNRNDEKVNACIETLCKCFLNIVNHPEKEKYKKIRISNRAFREKVNDIDGAIQFLEAAGFVREELRVQNGTEQFFVYPFDRVTDIERLHSLMETLEGAEKIELKLDRNARVLLPAEAARRIQLPDDFFEHSPKELISEQLSRREEADQLLKLRTNVSREGYERKKNANKEGVRKYRYALIRVRFPDGIALQGTFSVHEKFEEVVRFVEQNMITARKFSLLIPNGRQTFKPEDHSKTLMELQLVPAAVLICRTKTDCRTISYLRPDLVAAS